MTLQHELVGKLKLVLQSSTSGYTLFLFIRKQRIQLQVHRAIHQQQQQQPKTPNRKVPRALTQVSCWWWGCKQEGKGKVQRLQEKQRWASSTEQEPQETSIIGCGDEGKWVTQQPRAVYSGRQPVRVPRMKESQAPCPFTYYPLPPPHSRNMKLAGISVPHQNWTLCLHPLYYLKARDPTTCNGLEQSQLHLTQGCKPHTVK